MKRINRKKIIAIALLMILNSIVLAQSRTFTRIQKYVDAAVEEGLTGVNVYIKHPKKGVMKYSKGFASVEQKQELTPDKAMYLASISKTYCATAVLLACQDGFLKLDDKIEEYLPENINNGLPSGRVLTIRHLLNMSSGMFNYEWDTTLNKIYLSGGLKLDTVQHFQMIERYVFGKEQFFQPGTKYHYSSTNYLLLAKILDEALGYPHQDYITEKIIKEHNLRNTYYKNEYQKIGDLVEAYGDLNNDGILENISGKQWETTEWFIGDDGLIATASDVGIFLEYLLTGKILSKELLLEMTKWITPDNPDYGMGLMYDKSFPYGEAIGHSGVAIGATSDAYYFPKQQIMVVVMSNTGKRNGSSKYRRAYNQLLKRMIMKLFIL